MKLLFKALLIALILQGCQKSKDDNKQLSQSKPNHFTAENDTLVIRTKKTKEDDFLVQELLQWILKIQHIHFLTLLFILNTFRI